VLSQFPAVELVRPTAEVQEYQARNAAMLQQGLYAQGRSEGVAQSHAERQTFAQALPLIRQDVDQAERTYTEPNVQLGSSRNVCPEACRPFFRVAALIKGTTIPIGDPEGVWIFTGGNIFSRRPSPPLLRTGA